jgi:hypothetical protein
VWCLIEARDFALSPLRTTTTTTTTTIIIIIIIIY